jgi:hypothetical protein
VGWRGAQGAFYRAEREEKGARLRWRGELQAVRPLRFGRAGGAVVAWDEGRGGGVSALKALGGGKGSGVGEGRAPGWGSNHGEAGDRRRL